VNLLNIRSVKDPLGPNPKLVAATEPVPGVFTNNVTLSSDGKYLIGSYLNLDGSGSVRKIQTLMTTKVYLRTHQIQRYGKKLYRGVEVHLKNKLRSKEAS
jgi:hypothetical protein